MLILPSGFQRTISVFSSTFRKDVWKKVQVLLTGAIICPGSRTVCNLLRSVGLHKEKNFAKYHRLFNCDKWSAKWISAKLFHLLINTFTEKGAPLVLGFDDTIERRWGRKITKRGIYRDPVRSSKSHFVKCSGLRWLSLMLLTNLPWLSSGVYWALPILTVLCPSKGFYEKTGKEQKKLTDWARQIIIWLSRQTANLGRKVYLLGDGSFATYELFISAQTENIGLIARMKLNAKLYHLPSKLQSKNKPGPKPPVGKRLLDMTKRLTDKRIKWKEVIFSEWYGMKQKKMLITSGVAIWRKSNTVMVKIRWVLVVDPEEKLKPVLLACSDWELSAKKIVAFFVRRWRVEVTFQEVRRHLGVESQRQWSDLAIERETPSLLALFSIVCLLAHTLHKLEPIHPNTTAWYKKQHITFSDVLSTVRLEIWSKGELSISPFEGDIDNYSHRIRYLHFLLTQAVA